MALADDLQAIVTGYAQALVADAANPQPDYELNGKKVTREKWRASLWEALQSAQLMILKLQPYWVETVFRT